MNRAQLERRLDAIAGAIAEIQPKAPVDPDNPFEWMRWLDTDALRWVEGVIDRAYVHGIPPTAEERAQWLALEADAVRRRLAGESAESGRQCHS
jgi:hypothetical protein